jgi:hypothetical protein
MVTITDPEGFPFNVICGQEPRPMEPSASLSERLTFNYPDEKQRVRRFNRFEPGPAAVHKVYLLI